MNNIRKEVHLYLNQLDCFDSSRKTISSILRNFVQWTEQHPGVKPEEYKKFLENKGLKSKTIRNYLTIIKKFYSWKGEKFDVKLPKVSKRHTKGAVTKYDIARMIQWFDGKNDIISLRNRAIIGVLAVTGIRVHSLCQAKVTDVGKRGNKFVLYYKTKGRKDKDSYAILPSFVWELVNEYMEARMEVHPSLPEEDQFLFLSESSNKRPSRLSERAVSGIVKDALFNVGLVSDRYSCHSLRHAAAKILLESGAPMQDIKMMLGHENLSTTDLYIEEFNREENSPEETVADALADVFRRK